MHRLTLILILILIPGAMSESHPDSDSDSDARTGAQVHASRVWRPQRRRVRTRAVFHALLICLWLAFKLRDGAIPVWPRPEITEEVALDMVCECLVPRFG